MKEFKDIGKSIEERFESAQRQPSEALWDKIDDTLGRKKRSRFLLLLFSGIAATVLLGIGIQQQKSTTRDTQIVTSATAEQESSVNKKVLQQTNDLKNNSNNTPKKELGIAEHKTDTIHLEPNHSRSKLNTNEDAKNLEQKREQLGAFKISETQKKKNSSTKPELQNTEDLTDGFEKETTYYYYNSKDSIAISSKDKKLIDSIIKQAEIPVDTTTIKN